MPDNSETEHEINDKDEELDDLFGEDSDQENKSQTDNLNSDNDDEEIDEDNESDVEQREIHAIDLDLAKHPATNKSDDDEMYFTNLPAFLNVEPMPFDAPAFREQIMERQENLSTEDKMMEKLFAENVIRWRYNKVGDEVYKQSNCHFVEWSDGSLSMKLGNEIFDVVRNPTSDHFLTIRHNELEIFQTDSIFTKNMKLIPSSTNSEIHKRLTNYIKSKTHKDNDQINRALLEEDPEKVLERKTKEEEEAIRNQRKLEQRRWKEEERMAERGSRGTASSFGEVDEGVSGKIHDDYFDDDEEDDDFVAEDDEEIVSLDEEDELERSERLTKLKESGRKQYEEGDDEDEEDRVRVNKKRRVIEDDEDE